MSGVRPSVRPSVHLSVCLYPIRPPHADAAGLLLWARLVGRHETGSHFVTQRPSDLGI